MAATTRSILWCRLRDEGYARNRKVLRMPEKELIRVNDRVGLHPALRDLGELLGRGHLALVPGVGYPNPNRSHFESMAIWQTARLDPEEHGGPGWIGRSLDELAQTGETDGAAGAAALLSARGDASPPCEAVARRPRPGADRGPHPAAGWDRSTARRLRLGVRQSRTTA